MQICGNNRQVIHTRQQRAEGGACSTCYDDNASAVVRPGPLSKHGKELLQDVNRLELRASGLQITDNLRRELTELLSRHGGKVDSLGHPTTTLEDYFLRIVEESKAHPGRRFLPSEVKPK